MRDQLFDYQQEAVGYYLNQEIRFDIEFCYLGKPFNKIVQKMTRLASLTADANAPTKLLSEQTIKLKHYSRVVELGQRNKTLTSQIHNAEYRTISDAKETTLYKKKKKIEAELSCVKVKLRVRIISQSRKRHFRKTDIQAFDVQFSATTDVLIVASDIQFTTPIKYNIRKRAKIVQLICNSGDSLSDREKLRQRLQTIEARAALYGRREIQRRDRPNITVKQQESEKTVNKSEKNEKKDFSIICRPTQYLFCLDNKRLFYFYRIFEYSKPNKIINETERYLKRFVPKNQILCPHLQCRAAELILPSIIAFKNYTAILHRILLRA